MQMNPSIILSGQTPDPVGSMARGAQAASGINQVRRQNNLANLYQEQGAGLLSGDQNALNALAGLDPTQALGMQQTHQAMDIAGNSEDRASQKFKLEMQEITARMSAAEAAAAKQNLEGLLREAAVLYANGDREGFANLAQQSGIQIEFDQFPQKAMSMGADMWDALTEAEKRNAPAERQTIKGADGYTYFQDNGERVLPDVVAPEQTPLVDMSGMNFGDNPQMDDALRKRLMEKTGEAWSKISDAGINAARAKPDLEILGELAQYAPSGMITGRLAEAFPEHNDVSALRQAVIKRVAPTLRVEGSGSTSDVEYAGMIEGMGRLVNSPEANKAIADVMIAKSQLDIERANVVNEYASGKLTQTAARDALAELDSRSIMPPSLKQMLDGAKETQSDTGPKQIKTDADYDALPSGAEFIAPDGSRRRKP